MYLSVAGQFDGHDDAPVCDAERASPDAAGLGLSYNMPLDAAIITRVFALYRPGPRTRILWSSISESKIELLCIVTIAFFEAREKGTKRTPLYSADRSHELRRKVERHDYIAEELRYQKILTTHKSSLSYQTPKKLPSCGSRGQT